MKTNLTWFFVGVVVIAAMLVAVVPMMLRSVNGGQEASTSVEQAFRRARTAQPGRWAGWICRVLAESLGMPNPARPS